MSDGQTQWRRAYHERFVAKRDHRRKAIGLGLTPWEPEGDTDTWAWREAARETERAIAEAERR